MKIMNNHFLKFIIFCLMPFSIMFLSGCGAPLENLYEPGVESHLITLTYEGETPRVTSSGASIIPEIKYKVNRPIKDFVDRLQPEGNIVCNMELYHNVGGKTGYFDFLRSPILTFDIESLDETGVLKPIFFKYSSDMEKILRRSLVSDPVEATSGVYILVYFTDQQGKTHRGRVSNTVTFPSSFVLYQDW